MKTQINIIWTIIVIGLITTAVFASCKSSVKQSECSYKDSTLFLVFDSKCLIHPEDNDPVFMTVDQSIGKHKGDTLRVEEDGTYPDRTEIIRDNETHDDGLHPVVLGDYVYMKWYHK